MPRAPRLLLSKTYYHIMTRGNNKNIVFRHRENYQYYLDLIKKYKEEHPFDLYHYCLMPNHTHFLVKTNKASDFSNFMKRLNLAYFYHYKNQYGWVGHLWQDRYKSQPVGKDEYFIQCGKYIELNPVRANLVDNAEDYSYSSCSYYTKGTANNLITEDVFYNDLGESAIDRQRKYKELVTDDIVQETYKKKVWGEDKQRYNESKKIKYHTKEK